MVCQGGCIGGAGQSYLMKSLMAERLKGIYEIDKQKDIRISDDNSELQQVYKSFIGQAGSSKAYQLFHTHYKPQESAILAQ